MTRTMDELELSPEQRLMQGTAREYVDRVVLPFIRANRTREWLMDPDARLPPEILAEADAAGLRALGVPVAYGGIELDPGTEAQTFALIATELGRGDAGLADKLAQGWKVSVLLRHVAPEHLQARWFPRYMADPSFLMAHCLTEPRGASDRWLPYNVPAANMDTKARYADGYWTINGRKHYISNGYDASLYVVYANTNPAVGMLQGTSSFLVPRDTPGLTVTRCNETVGGRYMNNGEIVFEDCRVPDDHLLVRDDALGRAGVYFRPGKILQAAKNLGTGLAAFEDTARFVQQHVQGGAVLIKHQAVALRLARMATKLDAVTAFVRRAARAVDQD
ncbi:MAG TPA: acyl-CoA dehydrogenase family protein, partial [Candidatus Limnocylindrales bacterium]